MVITKKLSQLLADNPAADMDGTEIIEVTQSSATKGAKSAQFQALAPSATVKQTGTGAVAVSLKDSILRPFTPEQFGAVGDGVTDDSPALNSMLDAVWAQQVEAFKKSSGGNYPGTGVYNLQQPVMHAKPGAVYAVSEPFKLRSGQILHMNGATFKPIATCDWVLGTHETAADYYPDTGTGTQRGIAFLGVGYIENVEGYAKKGFYANHLSKCFIEHIMVVGTTLRAWSDGTYTVASVGTGASASILTLNETPGAEVVEHTVVRVYNKTTNLYERGIFEILSVDNSAKTVTLTSPLCSNLDFDTNDYALYALAVGIHINGETGNYGTLGAHQCDHGVFFGVSYSTGNSTPATDDNVVQQVIARGCNTGLGITSSSRMKIQQCVAVNNKYESINVVNSEVVEIYGYYGSAAPTDGQTIALVDDQTFAGWGNEDYPMVYIQGGAPKLQARLTAYGGTDWVRWIEMDAYGWEVDILGNGANSPERPGTPPTGDYSIMRLMPRVSGKTGGKLWISEVHNLTSNPNLAVVDEDYNFPSANVIVESNAWGQALPKRAGSMINQTEFTESYKDADGNVIVQLSHKNGLLLNASGSPLSSVFAMTEIKRIFTNLTPASVAAGAVSTQTFDVGALNGIADVIVSVIPPSSQTTITAVNWSCPTPGTLAVQFINPTANPVTPASGSYSLTVLTIHEFSA